MLIEGAVAIVLGGAGGIGKACCKALLVKGAKVVCADIADEKLVADLGSERNFAYFRCNSTSDDDVKELFEKTKIRFGNIPDIVMTTVAIIDEFDWQRCVEVNVGGVIRLVNAALATMGTNSGGNGGSVTILSSVSGLKPEFWGPVYSATKHAVTALARSWAMEENYSRHGIRFNCLCPATVDTPFLQQVRRAHFSEKKQMEIEENPKMTPETVADAFIRITEQDSFNGASVVITDKAPFVVHEFANIDC